MQRRTATRVGMPLVALLIAVGLAACGGGDDQEDVRSVALAPAKVLPETVRSAPSVVREAYQFAVANPELLRAVECYCGCGSMGHTSNLSCFVSGMAGESVQSYDDHALGCSICVDIAMDVMRLWREGQPLDTIRWYVDARYNQFGPPTPS